MPNHLYAFDANRHPPQGASTATTGQVMKALGSDVISWVTIGGDISGAPDALSVTDLTIGSQATGDLIYFNGTNWVRRAATTNGFVLTLSGGLPVWAASGGGGGIGGSTGGVDNVLIRADGTGGALIQDSVVVLTDAGALSGITGYAQTSGNLSVTGNGTITLGNAGTGTINVVPGSGGLNIEAIDDDSAAVSIAQGANVYFRVVTTNAAERLILGGALATLDVEVTAGDDMTISTGGDVDIQIASSAGSATAYRIRDGASLTDVYFSVDTTNDTVTIGNSSTGASTVTINSGTGGLNFNIVDNDTAAFTIQQSSNIYFRVRTSNVSETITIGGATNPRIDIGGTGALGRTDATAGVSDVAGIDMRIRAGAGTGAGTPGYLYLSTPSAHASDSVVQTQTDRIAIAGSATVTGVYIGNPDADNTVATPVTDVFIRATTGNGAAQGTDLLIVAGGNTDTGRGGHLTLAAGFAVGAAVGGDATLVAGDSDGGVPGTLRLAVRGDVDGVGTDALTINYLGDVNLTGQTVGMADTIFERYRFTANTNGSAQDVLTHVVTSGAVAWMRVVAVWRGSSLANCAVMELLGGVTNNSGTVDEIGGATFSATGTRMGAALTDTVEIRIVAGNGPDELKLQLFKINGNNYTVDVYVTYHEC